MEIQQKVDAAKNAVDVGIAVGAGMTLLEWANWAVIVITIVLGLMRIIIEYPKMAHRVCEIVAGIKKKFGRK